MSVTLSSPMGCSYATIAAGAAGPTIIKSTPGVFLGVLITSVGAGAPLAYDNASAASGNVIGAIPASAVLGLASTVPSGGVKFTNGLTFVGGATMPAMTIFYL